MRLYVLLDVFIFLIPEAQSIPPEYRQDR
jgi:hypothetical protein